MRRITILGVGVVAMLSTPPLSLAQTAAGAAPMLVSAPATAPLSALEAAVAEFRATGMANTVPPARPGDFTVYPYGYSQPYLRCAALVLCVIELQPGETLTDDPLPGDPSNWDADKVTAGANSVVQVLVRGKRCDARTNLVISTTRRRYIVDLEIGPCRSGTLRPQGEYMPGIRFWYPEEAVREPEPKPSVQDELAVHVSALNLDYRWDRSRRLTWTPVHVFDDGVRTYVQLAPEARNGEMPVLYLVADDGRREILNYVIRPDPAGDFLVMDRVVKQAQLVTTVGKKERRLRILNAALQRRERGR